MATIRIRVAPLGNGYIAEGGAPFVTAAGSSAEEAAENARRAALESLETLGTHKRPSTLIVSIEEPVEVRSRCSRSTKPSRSPTPANRMDRAISIAQATEPRQAAEAGRAASKYAAETP
jgi:hypothetical protein